MKKTTITLLIAVMFIGTSLRAPAFSNVNCIPDPCKLTCQDEYDAARNNPPTLGDIMDAVENGDPVPPMDAACYGGCLVAAIGIGLACLITGGDPVTCTQHTILAYFPCIATCFDSCLAGCWLFRKTN